MRTSNPVLGARLEKAIAAAPASATPMTRQGTAVKTLVLLLLTVFAAAFTWGAPEHQRQSALYTGALGGLAVGLLTVFRPALARVTAPIYAVLEGLAVGAISGATNAVPEYHGLPLLAVGLTFGVAAAMFALYAFGIVKPTERFVAGVCAATWGICCYYLVAFAGSFAGMRMPLIDTASPLGILFSVGVCAIAALGLILDFAQVDAAIEEGAPAELEWYSAFAMLVSIVWLYLEVLRLLRKLRR